MHEGKPAKRGKRVLLIASIVVAIALAVAIPIYLSVNEPPYRFITKLHGTRIDGSREDLSNGYRRLTRTFGGSPHVEPGQTVHYIFDVPKNVLEKSIADELSPKGLLISSLGKDYHVYIVMESLGTVGSRRSFMMGGNTLDQVQMQLMDVDGEKQWVVSFDRQPTWLDKMWVRMKRWFGAK